MALPRVLNDDIEELKEIRVDLASVKEIVFNMAQIILEKCEKIQAELPDAVLHSITDVANRLLQHKDTFAGKMKSIRTLGSPGLFASGVILSAAPKEFCAALHSVIAIGEAFGHDAMKYTAQHIINLFGLANPKPVPENATQFREFNLKLQKELEMVASYRSLRYGNRN